MASPNALAQSRSPSRSVKLSKWVQRLGLSVGLGGSETTSSTDPPSEAPAFPFPISQAILRGKSILVICDEAVARQEICGALYKDEKNPEASSSVLSRLDFVFQVMSKLKKFLQMKESLSMNTIPNERVIAFTSPEELSNFLTSIAMPFSVLTLLLFLSHRVEPSRPKPSRN